MRATVSVRYSRSTTLAVWEKRLRGGGLARGLGNQAFDLYGLQRRVLFGAVEGGGVIHAEGDTHWTSGSFCPIS